MSSQFFATMRKDTVFLKNALPGSSKRLLYDLQK